MGQVFTFGEPVMAGLLAANALSVAALLLLGRVLTERHGCVVGAWAIGLLLAHPGALFLSFIYSEPLFLFLVAAFFYGLQRRRYGIVALTGFLLPLARAVGIFIILPLAWHLWAERQGRMRWCLALVPLVGYATDFAIMYGFTGNPFEGFEAQRDYPNSPSILNIVNLPGFVQALFWVDSLHDVTTSLIDRACFLVFLATLPAIYSLDKRYFLYAMGVGLVPALSNWFFSYTRFAAMCFPIFVALSVQLAGEHNKWSRWYLVTLFGAVHVVFLLRHINFHWAG